MNVNQVLKTKAILYSTCILSALLFTIGALFVEYNIHSKISKNKKEMLEAIVQSNRTAIENLFQAQEDAIQYWSRSPLIKNMTIKLLKHKNNPEDLKQRAPEVQMFLDPIKESLNLEGYFIISKSGINLTSSRLANVGIPGIVASDKQLWAKVLKGNTVFSKLQPSDVPLINQQRKYETNRATFFTVAPIFDENNQILAILSFRVDPYVTFWDILERSRLGKSGDTYAIDQNARLLSPKRKNEKNSLSWKVLETKIKQPNGELTHMAKDLINGKTGYNIKGYQDNSGRNVIGYWAWIDKLGFGLVSEIDYDEAFSLFQKIRYLLWPITLFLFLTLFFIFKSGQNKISSLIDDAEEKQIHLQSIFENANGVIYRCDPNQNWTMTYINSHIEDISGYPAEEFINDKVRSYASIIAPEHKEMVESIVFKAIKEQTLFKLEYDIIDKYNNRKSVFEQGQGIFKDDSCLKIDGFIIDITEK